MKLEEIRSAGILLFIINPPTFSLGFFSLSFLGAELYVLEGKGINLVYQRERSMGRTTQHTMGAVKNGSQNAK